MPNGTAIDAYVEAMKRHDGSKVVLLLGVGGVQKDDASWIAAAARRHGGRVLAGIPVAEPVAADAAFVRVLGVAARHGLPVVIRQEADAEASAELELALGAARKATIVLAHAGGAEPAVLDLRLDAAERIAHRNAAALLRIE